MRFLRGLRSAKQVNQALTEMLAPGRMLRTTGGHFLLCARDDPSLCVVSGKDLTELCERYYAQRARDVVSGRKTP